MQKQRVHAENSMMNYIAWDIWSNYINGDKLMIGIGHFGNAHETGVFQFLTIRSFDQMCSFYGEERIALNFHTYLMNYSTK